MKHKNTIAGEDLKNTMSPYIYKMNDHEFELYNHVRNILRHSDR